MNKVDNKSMRPKATYKEARPYIKMIIASQEIDGRVPKIKDIAALLGLTKEQMYAYKRKYQQEPHSYADCEAGVMLQTEQGIGQPTVMSRPSPDGNNISEGIKNSGVKLAEYCYELLGYFQNNDEVCQMLFEAIQSIKTACDYYAGLDNRDAMFEWAIWRNSTKNYLDSLKQYCMIS